MQRLRPSCPLCRTLIHQVDVPTRDEVRMQRCLFQPAFASMRADLRPTRLARETFILRRENIRAALDRLTAERERLQRSRPITGQSCNTGESCNVGESVQVDDDEVAQQEDDELFRRPDAVHESQHSRSRSPISPVSSQALAVATLDGDDFPALEGSPIQIQAVQMYIGVQRNILENIESLQESDLPREEIVISDDESEIDADESPDVPDAVLIVGHVGKGRNIRYQVLWRDGTETLVRQEVIKRIRYTLLSDYRVKLNRERVARCRAKKAMERDDQYDHDGPCNV